MVPNKPIDTEWVTYLKETNNYANFDGMCGCYLCREIQDAFTSWKVRKNSLAIQLKKPLGMVNLWIEDNLIF